MRRTGPAACLALASLLASPFAMTADGAGSADVVPSRSDAVSMQCHLSTPYNVLVDTGGVWLYRHSGVPREIVFHDGTLSVDREVRTVGEDDARRLRALEAGARAVMPDVAGLGRESTDLAFDALAGVVEALTGSRRQVRRVEGLRRDALAHIDATLGTGRWDQDVYGPGLEQKIEAAAASMAGSLGRSVLWQAFTGRADRMEARAGRVEATLEQRIEARSAALGARAAALCDQVERLAALQAALDYRFEGQPLMMIESAPPDTGRTTARID